jgi:hypothetical protein
MSDAIFMWGLVFGPEEVNEIVEEEMHAAFLRDEAHYDAVQFEIFLCDELGLNALVELDLA